MKKLFAATSLLALCFTAACVAAPRSDTDKKVQTPAANQPLTAEVNKEKAEQLAGIQRDFETLEAKKPGLLAVAQANEVCDAYNRVDNYENLKARLDRIGLSDAGDFASTLNGRVSQVGREASSLAYMQMKASKSFDCGPEVGEAHIISEFAAWMDKYGAAKEGETFEPAVVRVAYLRAIKPKIQQALAEFVRRPEGDGTRDKIAGLIQDAQHDWHFTLSELGVPAEVQKKLEL